MSPPFPCKHQVAGIEDYYLIPIIVCYNKIIDVDLVNTWAACNYITQLFSLIPYIQSQTKMQSISLIMFVIVFQFSIRTKIQK